jgi:hypothetical protein
VRGRSTGSGLVVVNVLKVDGRTIWFPRGNTMGAQPRGGRVVETGPRFGAAGWGVRAADADKPELIRRFLDVGIGRCGVTRRG